MQLDILQSPAPPSTENSSLAPNLNSAEDEKLLYRQLNISSTLMCSAKSIDDFNSHIYIPSLDV